jgi:hypothetical protein
MSTQASNFPRKKKFTYGECYNHCPLLIRCSLNMVCRHFIQLFCSVCAGPPYCWKYMNSSKLNVQRRAPTYCPQCFTALVLQCISLLHDYPYGSRCTSNWNTNAVHIKKNCSALIFFFCTAVIMKVQFYFNVQTNLYNKLIITSDQNVMIWETNECGSTVPDNSATYSGCHRLEFLIVFLNPSRQMKGWYIKSGHESFPSTSFPIYYSCIILKFDTI